VMGKARRAAQKMTSIWSLERTTASNSVVYNIEGNLLTKTLVLTAIYRLS
jgi:hypothetical protein